MQKTNMRRRRKYFREKSPTVTMTITKQTGWATKRTAEIKLCICAIIFRWGKKKLNKTMVNCAKLCKTLQNSGLAGLIFVSVFVFVCVFVNMCQGNVNIIHFPQINLLRNSSSSASPSKKSGWWYLGNQERYQRSAGFKMTEKVYPKLTRLSHFLSFGSILWK